MQSQSQLKQRKSKLFSFISSFKFIYCLSLIVLLFNVDIIHANTQNRFPLKDDRYTLPQLDVEVKLSDKAQKQLKALGERIRVVFYFFYEETDQGSNPHKKLTSDERFLSFITTRELILPATSGTAFLSEWNIPYIKNKTFDAILLVNVMSARDNCSFNLLNCSIYHDKYPTNSRQKIPLTCDVINDVPSCH